MIDELTSYIPHYSANKESMANPNNQSLAMAYVPQQNWRNLYSPEVALNRGTLFAELDKPFTKTYFHSNPLDLCMVKILIPSPVNSVESSFKSSLIHNCFCCSVFNEFQYNNQEEIFSLVSVSLFKIKYFSSGVF